MSYSVSLAGPASYIKMLPVLVTPLLIQFSTNTPGKAVGEGLCARPLCREISTGFLVWLHLWSESVVRRYLSPFLSLSCCCSINKYLERQRRRRRERGEEKEAGKEGREGEGSKGRRERRRRKEGSWREEGEERKRLEGT